MCFCKHFVDVYMPNPNACNVFKLAFLVTLLLACMVVSIEINIESNNNNNDNNSNLLSSPSPRLS
jgi:hypothetical protein